MQHRGKSHLILPTRTRAATSVVVAAHRWLPARTAVRDSARIVLGIGSRQIRQAFGGSETGRQEASTRRRQRAGTSWDQPLTVRVLCALLPPVDAIIQSGGGTGPEKPRQPTNSVPMPDR